MLKKLPKDVQYIIFRYLHILKMEMIMCQLSITYESLYEDGILRHVDDSMLCNRILEETHNFEYACNRAWRVYGNIYALGFYYFYQDI